MGFKNISSMQCLAFRICAKGALEITHSIDRQIALIEYSIDTAISEQLIRMGRLDC